GSAAGAAPSGHSLHPDFLGTLRRRALSSELTERTKNNVKTTFVPAMISTFGKIQSHSAIARSSAEATLEVRTAGCT
ncbi:hypothetical protein ABTA67_20185, partial [Acinetobacter baumannii]